MSLADHLPRLRAINYRLSSTAVENLPLCAGQLAAQLWNIKDVLGTPAESLQSHPELSSLSHRFRTTLSSLLQDRTIEGRWAAVVITKAAVEAGGLETLSKTSPWVKSLLAILKKPDPPTTRILAAVTLTRIFSLTWNHSQLVREITTPALPTFIASCLSNVDNERCTPDETQNTLEAFVTLLPRHPTLFRPHEAQIRKLLACMISRKPDRSNAHYEAKQIDLAQTLFVLLHHCAAKHGGAEKWHQGVKWAVKVANETCDRLSMPVRYHGARPELNNSMNGSAPSGNAYENRLELAPWDGIYAGSARLISLLGIIEAQARTPTFDAVETPVGLISELLCRILGSVGPNSHARTSSKLNPEMARDEREAISIDMPRIHIATLAVFDVLLARFGPAISPILQNFTELLGSLLLNQGSDRNVRAAIFCSTGYILEISGRSFSKEMITELIPTIKVCCDALLTKEEMHSDLSRSAQALLPQLFSQIEQANIPPQIRAQMERTAVLTNHRAALTSSVINPVRKDNHATLQPSLLPILLSLHPNSPESEAIMRPRMPMMTIGAGERDVDAVQVSETNLAGITDIEHRDTVSPDLTSVSDAKRGSLLSDDEDSYSRDPPVLRHNHKQEMTIMYDSIPNVGAQSAAKRPAMDVTLGTSPTKRFRASPLPKAPSPKQENPIIAAPAQGNQRELCVHDTAPQSDLGNMRQQNKPPSEQTVFVKGDSDDSDFEMPEINPDPDTDTEEDEEEEEAAAAAAAPSN